MKCVVVIIDLSQYSKQCFSSTTSLLSSINVSVEKNCGGKLDLKVIYCVACIKLLKKLRFQNELLVLIHVEIEILFSQKVPAYFLSPRSQWTGH